MNSTKNTVNKHNPKRVLLLGNSHLVIFRFRKELVNELVAKGYDVWVSFPNGPFGEGEETSKAFGCHFIETEINRRGKNPLQELSLVSQYKKIMKSISPDVVLAFTVKCDIYGGIACRKLNIPFIPNITGLGAGLADGGIVEKITIFLYKKAIKEAKCIFFQNNEDKKYFDDHGIKYKESIVLPGSGVNLQEYTILPYPQEDMIRVTYIARVMKAKGIEQFLEAAKVIHFEFPNTEFHICGYCEEDYKDVIAKNEKEGTVIYHGLVDNIIDYERMSHCIVLPTFHPEGISNVLLEGAACARPIITTNRPGCRETVNDGVTGYLIKERDSDDLIEKMRKFIGLSNEERENMGIAGRRKIEREFDRKIVVDFYISKISNLVG